MMASAEIQKVDLEIDTVLQCLMRDGVMDEQFEQLLCLQDESEPDFVKTVMDLFFQVRSGCPEKDAGGTTRLNVLLACACGIAQQC